MKVGHEASAEGRCNALTRSGERCRQWPIPGRLRGHARKPTGIVDTTAPLGESPRLGIDAL
jgi:hypothetical protein